MLRILIPIFSLFLGISACSSEQSAIALNGYTRIDHAPGCGEDNVALIVGKDTLLCPIELAFYNGDSLAVTSEGKCYFIDLQRITEYKRDADLAEINCEGLEDFVVVGARVWPRDTRVSPKR